MVRGRMARVARDWWRLRPQEGFRSFCKGSGNEGRQAEKELAHESEIWKLKHENEWQKFKNQAQKESHEKDLKQKELVNVVEKLTERVNAQDKIIDSLPLLQLLGVFSVSRIYPWVKSELSKVSNDLYEGEKGEKNAEKGEKKAETP